MKVSQVQIADADIRLLRDVAAKLVEHGETGLAYRVDALGDELNRKVSEAYAADVHNNPPGF